VPASAIANNTDREIIFDRIFDAPPAVVYNVWTDPEHLTHWYGPNGFTTAIQEMDVRPGGVWHLIMRGPDGADYKNRLVFLEVVKFQSLVYRHEPDKGSEAATHETTVTFAPEPGGKTRLRMRMLFTSAAERERIVTKYHAIEGGNQTLGRLAAHLARTTAASVVFTRIFDAPRELVFQAWTDPAHLKHWWGPTGFTNPVCEFDARPGGAIRIHMRAPDGVIYPMSGTVQQVDEPNRLVFISSALDENGDPFFRQLNNVTFEDQDGKTKLTLHVTVSNITERGRPFIAGMEMGWNLSLDRLAKLIAR